MLILPNVAPGSAPFHRGIMDRLLAGYRMSNEEVAKQAKVPPSWRFVENTLPLKNQAQAEAVTNTAIIPSL